MKAFMLSQLLLFFKRQQEVGFQGINFCVAIVESEELSDSDKLDALHDLFERMELYDVDIEMKPKILEDDLYFKECETMTWDIPGMGPLNVTQIFDAIF